MLDNAERGSTDNSTPLPDSPFAHMLIGTIGTPFGERIVRVHHATFDDPPPPWFAPMESPRYVGMHSCGFSTYYAVDVNRAARDAAHPFEAVRANAVHIEQTSLFS